MEKTLDFLKEAQAFFFGTADGDRPEARPFGFFMEFEGKLYFGMGQHKKVYEQLKRNHKFVVCALKGMEWIRIRAAAGLEAPEEAYRRAFEDNPFLKSIYNDESGLKFALVEAKHATVEFCGMLGPVEKRSL
jgi:uncharacterized pyridoxamine 5'-phosphate oxidase family protein